MVFFFRALVVCTVSRVFFVLLLVPQAASASVSAAPVAVASASSAAAAPVAVAKSSGGRPSAAPRARPAAAPKAKAVKAKAVKAAPRPAPKKVRRYCGVDQRTKKASYCEFFVILFWKGGGGRGGRGRGGFLLGSREESKARAMVGVACVPTYC